MLRGIHKASSNWLGKAIMAVVMGLLVISFAIWGIGDIFRGFGRNAVAKIGGTEISIEQFRQLLHRPAAAARPPAWPGDHARPGARARPRPAAARPDGRRDRARRAARKLRLGLSDAEIARRITSDPSFRGLNGQFDRTRFEQLIRQAGFTEARFVDEQRRDAAAPADRAKRQRRIASADDRAVRDQSIPEREAQHRISGAGAGAGRRYSGSRRRKC